MLQNPKTPQSMDTRQKFYAGSWVDQATEVYIEHRVKDGRRRDKDYSRSRAIRDIIRERAQDESFQASQAILLPLIRETMRAEHRRFEDRSIALQARMVYQVSWVLALLIKFVSFVLGNKAKVLITESETAAREHITRRTPQIEEVIGRLKEAREE